jgi:ankyrin repeat protein
MNRHSETGSNALHVAVERHHENIVKMLIESGYPLNITKQDGVTALIISCHKEIDEDVKNISR